MAGMVPEDVYELTGVSDPRVSPDGRTVVFVVWRLDRESNGTKGAIWLAATDGSPRRASSRPVMPSTPTPDGLPTALGWPSPPSAAPTRPSSS